MPRFSHHHSNVKSHVTHTQGTADSLCYVYSQDTSPLSYEAVVNDLVYVLQRIVQIS